MQYDYQFRLISLEGVNEQTNTLAQSGWEPFLITTDQVKSRSDGSYGYLHTNMVGIMFRRAL